VGPTQPPIQREGALFPGGWVKRPGYEADHLPPSSDVKNARNYISSSPYVFVA